MQLEPTHLVARLGLAWCLEQAGRQADAISEYRTLVEQAWLRERISSVGTTRYKPFVTEEAGQRLLPLLNPDTDIEEIRQIKTRIGDVAGRSIRAITPLVVPLESTWLVYDDGAGEIKSGLQLFGTVSFWMFWNNGYEALCALDDSGDGVLSGAELKHLALWHDVNTNGRSDAGEVRPVERYGIVELSCRHIVVSDEESSIAAYSSHGVRFVDGSTRPTYDLILRSWREPPKPGERSW